MMDFRCDTCGAEIPEPGMLCSSSAVLVCRGRAPVAGCGNVLTSEERHYYGDCCNTCEGLWGERIEAWRKGGTDAELDKMLEAPPPQLH